MSLVMTHYLWASVSLSTKPWRLFTRLCLVVCQDVGGVLPLGVVVDQVPLLVEAVWSGEATEVSLAVLDGRDLPDVVDGRPEVTGPVGEGAVEAVLDAETLVVSVVDTHTRLVVLRVVATLSVAGRPVQVRTPGIKTDFFIKFGRQSQFMAIVCNVVRLT